MLNTNLHIKRDLNFLLLAHALETVFSLNYYETRIVRYE